MQTDEEMYHELLFYTLAHSDLSFIHQHAVDTYAAQHATLTSKPIAVAFALIGLYLWLERGLNGREVQRAHMRLARHRKQWPTFHLPPTLGSIDVADVLKVAPGPERDAMIRRWAEEVWKAWQSQHPRVAELVTTELGIM